MSAEQVPEPISEAARLLQQADAMEVQRQAEVEQRNQELRRILVSLDAAITGNAPHSERLSLPSGWGWRLRGAELHVSAVQSTQFQVTGFEEMFSQLSGNLYTYRSSFDVKAESSVVIIAGLLNKKMCDLWYCNAQEYEIFDWYAVACDDSKFPVEMISVRAGKFVDVWIERFARAANRYS